MQEKINKTKRRIITLLKWSEKYTKTDMLYLASGGFWLALAQGVTILSAFFVTVLLTRVLPQESFGEYRFVLASIPLLALFTLPGMGASLTHSTARKTVPNINTMIHTKIRWGMIGAVLSLILAFYYYLQGSTHLAQLFVIVSIFIPFYDTFILYAFYLKGSGDFKRPALYEIISRLLQASTLLCVAFFTKSILLLLLAYLISKVLTELFFYMRVFRSYPEKIKDKATSLSIQYGKKLSMTTSISLLSSTLDKILVWHFLGASLFAVYILLLILPIQLAQLMSLGNQLILTKLSAIQSIQTNLYKKYNRLFLVILGLLITLMLCVLPIISYLFPILFSSYASYAYMLIYAIPLLVIIPLKDAVFTVLISQKQHKGMIIGLLASIGVYGIFLVFSDINLQNFLIALAIKEAAALIVGIVYLYWLQIVIKPS